jgi:hypothetical protein
MKLRCKIGSINFITGRPAVVKGEIFEAEATLAQHLISEGLAEEVPPEAAPVKGLETAVPAGEAPKRTRGRK